MCSCHSFHKLFCPFSQFQNSAGDLELLSFSVLTWWFWSRLIRVNYFSFDRQGLFVILRDFSGMTQILIPQEEVSYVSDAGVFNAFMKSMFWNVFMHSVCLSFEINTAWPHSRVCHQSHRNSQTTTSGTGKQGLVFVVRTFSIITMKQSLSFLPRESSNIEGRFVMNFPFQLVNCSGIKRRKCAAAVVIYRQLFNSLVFHLFS